MKLARARNVRVPVAVAVAVMAVAEAVVTAVDAAVAVAVAVANTAAKRSLIPNPKLQTQTLVLGTFFAPVGVKGWRCSWVWKNAFKTARRIESEPGYLSFKKFFK